MSNIIKANKPFNVDDLSTLLQNRMDHSTLNTSITRIVPKDTSNKTKAKLGATLSDFIKMVSKIVSKAGKNSNIIFEPDEGARPTVDQAQKLEEPHIYYEVLSRFPDKELKPRLREEVYDANDKNKQQRKGRVFGQRFECHVQFNIFADGYDTADKVMNRFEELMFNYTSYFKENGVAEIIFEGQATDRNYDIYRENSSIRSLKYCVWIEKLFTVFDTQEIDGIITS